MKFLIVRFSSIGDIVLTTPVIRCLKKQEKNAVVHYVTKNQYLPILKANPYLDKIFTIRDNIREIISQLKQENYDYIIDLHNNIRSIVLKSQLFKTSYSFDKINIEKWITVNFKINILPHSHIVDRYMNTLKPFRIINDNAGLDYFIPIEESVDFSLIPLSHRENYIAFAIGGSYNTKRLPEEIIIKICQLIKRPIFLLGGSEDKEIGERILKTLGEKIYNGCGKFSLSESASVIKQASAVISHDTGMMHVAAAFKKNIISIWGNTIPEFGMSPYMAGEKSLIMEVEKLKCRPCSKLGYNKCPKDHFDCMKKIDYPLIVDYINTL